MVSLGFRLLRVTSPAGHALGWIAPELIVRVRAGGNMIQFKDGDRLEDAYVDGDVLKWLLSLES